VEWKKMRGNEERKKSTKGAQEKKLGAWDQDMKETTFPNRPDQRTH
jgi:hypothetical protein